MDSVRVIGEEALALRLLELARHLAPSGNRVEFVHSCEEQGIRRYLQEFPGIWQRITDSPPREGIVSDEEFRQGGRDKGSEALQFQCRIIRRFEEVGIRTLAFQGPSLALQLFGEPTGGAFEEIDLFISPKDATQAAEILVELGFRAGFTQGVNSRQRADFFRFGGADGFYREGGSQHLLLYWRLFPSWLGPDLLPFEDAWGDSVLLEHNGCVWRTLGPDHTLMTSALMAYAFGFSRLHRILDIALCLERLDFSWSEVLEHASYRAVLVERAVEMCVKILGAHHPAEPTHYYSDLRQVVAEWRDFQSSPLAPTKQLLKPKYWSCHSSEALTRSLRAVTWPHWADIQKYSLPSSLRWLYHVLAVFHFAVSLVRRESTPQEE